MKILHGTWIPEEGDKFVRSGEFYLWVETEPKIQGKNSRKNSSRDCSNDLHPNHLSPPELAAFLLQVEKTNPVDVRPLEAISLQYFLLPTAGDRPLSSLELARYQETELPEEFDWKYWQIHCYRVGKNVKVNSYKYATVNNSIQLLEDLHFLAICFPEEIQLGSDLFFWYHYTRSLKQVLLRDRYIPALKYRELTPDAPPKKGRKTTKFTQKSTAFETYPGWEILSEDYEADIQQYAECMPLACVSGCKSPQSPPQLYDPESLLRHFSECLITEIVSHTPSTAQFDRAIAGTLLQDCLETPGQPFPKTNSNALEKYQQWQLWRHKIARTQAGIPFYLYFQLLAPDREQEAWQLQFLVGPKTDPSLKLSLSDYWDAPAAQKKQLQAQKAPGFGRDFESNLLLNLGHAARIYPQLWQGLESDRPVGIFLDLAGAFAFLKETAWVLEDAGYKVIVPAWWTPAGRQRAKLRLKVSSGKSSAKTENKGYFSLNSLVQYQYELAIGDEPVSPQEWQQLVAAKTPLVQFRGQWIELDPAKMQQMLEFWESHGKDAQIAIAEMLKREAEAGEEFEWHWEGTLAAIRRKLSDKSRLEPVETLPQLQGTLREYQKRGVSWLKYLESLGLNGCLADDMGLGKTVQTIARLVQEREDGATVPPTLLIAPTSVLGNWEREIAKFAPHLKAIVHHGSSRIQEVKAFQDICTQHDVVITSYTLVRKDIKLFTSVDWQRLILDEAQNIKNPKAEQTKAILKLSGRHRLALTGTPVENRLLDLWSIFNFLNPGYLGKQTQFRKTFEVPIQKENDRRQAATLKKLVEPFILRRVKTDKAIIKDLPDKVEQKVYCNLTKEQASLYEAVVRDVEKKIEELDGIDRRGLILATLMKLKQVCNHPRQFLQDSSDFSSARSHKLSRLYEMLEEVVAEEESLLIFTQFTEIGDALHHHLHRSFHYNTYYIHGGTNRNKRERAIAEFQDPETPPSVFILSLKAGGVGITLTKANHVFHFDRWWNPAVEDQATDRAFRIGQQKNVFVHKFVTLGTLEERIDRTIEDKKQLASAIVGSDESWLTELDNERFKELIALDRSAVLD